MTALRLDRPTPTTATITIDRPDSRNALRRSDLTEFTALLQGLATESQLSAVVVTGNGAFCAGADLKGLRDVVTAGPVSEALYEPAHALIRQLVSMPVPVIAALDGPAIGMGADIALACDCRILGPDGWLRQGWAAHGVIPATGGLLFLRHLAPSAIWKLLDGQPLIDGPTAERLGIGEASNERAVVTAERRAQGYAAIPRPALAAYVRFSRRAVRDELDSELADLASVQAELFNDARFAQHLADGWEHTPARARPPLDHHASGE